MTMNMQSMNMMPMPMPSKASLLMSVEATLSNQLNQMCFSEPVSYVYNPLLYAWETHSLFVTKYGNSPKKILFVGMNPGPWGMSQTGIPFGEVNVVQKWLNVYGSVCKPAREHPLRPIEGFQCQRSEVSGQRFWGLFQDICGPPENFFRNCFVYSYCPLAFMKATSKNITPPELKAKDRQLLFAFCDEALCKVMQVLEVDTVIAIGKFAEKRVHETLAKTHMTHIKVGCLLHPSPINPAANKNWKEIALKTLNELQVMDLIQGRQPCSSHDVRLGYGHAHGHGQ